MSATNSTKVLLQRIAGEITVTARCSGFEYRWGDHGQKHKWAVPKFLGKREDKNPDSSWARWSLETALNSAIYDIYYLGGGVMNPWATTNMGMLESQAPWKSDPEFLAGLELATVGHGRFEPGWQVVGIRDNGEITVDNGRIVIAVDRIKHLSPEAPEPNVGDQVMVRFPNAWKRFGPSQLFIFGDLHWQHVPGHCVRIYFRIHPGGGAALIRELTTRLNERRLAFNLKVLSNPILYRWRPDSAVLYTMPEDFAEVRPIVKDVYRCTRHWFRSDIPAFCKPLDPGLALAEDPRPSNNKIESFGMNRSRLVAEGLIAACETEGRGASHRLKHILARFAEEGVSLERPWLNPASTEEYEWA